MRDLLTADGVTPSLFTVRELRDMFNVARSTVYRWINAGRLHRVGHVQDPDRRQAQRVALLELVDETLRTQASDFLVKLRATGRRPRFLAQRLTVVALANLPAAPAGETSPAEGGDATRRLVEEFEQMLQRLGEESAARGQLLSELEAASRRMRQDRKVEEQTQAMHDVLESLAEVRARELAVLQSGETVTAPSSTRSRSVDRTTETAPRAPSQQDAGGRARRSAAKQGGKKSRKKAGEASAASGIAKTSEPTLQARSAVDPGDLLDLFSEEPGASHGKATAPDTAPVGRKGAPPQTPADSIFDLDVGESFDLSVEEDTLDRDFLASSQPRPAPKGTTQPPPTDAPSEPADDLVSLAPADLGEDEEPARPVPIDIPAQERSSTSKGPPAFDTFLLDEEFDRAFDNLFDVVESLDDVGGAPDTGALTLDPADVVGAVEVVPEAPAVEPEPTLEEIPEVELPPRPDSLSGLLVALGIILLVMSWILAVRLRMSNSPVNPLLLFGANVLACAAILGGRYRARRLSETPSTNAV